MLPSGQVTGGGGGGGGGVGHGWFAGICSPVGQVCNGCGGGVCAQAASITAVVVARISVSLISLSFRSGVQPANEAGTVTFLGSRATAGAQVPARSVRFRRQVTDTGT